MAVKNIFVCGHRHVSRETARQLEDAAEDYLFDGVATPYGWFIFVDPDYKGKEGYEKMPADLRAIYDKAVAAGAEYLLIDEDGHSVKGLRTYVW